MDTLIADGRRSTSLFEVERDARWRIWALFGLLILVVGASLAPLTLVLAALLRARHGASGSGGAIFGETVGATLALAVVGATVSWIGSRRNARQRLLKALRATPVVPGDTYHHELANIVDEIRLAAGLDRLDAIVLRSLSVNAVSFADPSGRACVGATEGALSRLSRPQLQTVVAHEVAHVASRDCVVATRAGLLFLGVRRLAHTYGRAGRPLVIGACAVVYFFTVVSVVVQDYPARVAGPATSVQTGLWWFLAAVLICMALLLSFWIATAAGWVVDLALSRQREYAADAAAARFTRDPVSLAEALQVIEWQQGAVMAVPHGLAPLLIAPVGGQRRSGWSRWFDGHPPLTERIERLQAMAHAQGQTMWARRVEVEQRVKAREHLTPARTARGGVGHSPAAAGTTAGCPRCGAALHRLVYEGAPVIECPVCGGIGATRPQVDAILARRDWGFTPGQIRIANMIEAYQDAAEGRAASATSGRPPLDLPWVAESAEAGICPLCDSPMRRAAWSLAYPLPADSCDRCDLQWFDRDELEVLQILVERQTI